MSRTEADRCRRSRELCRKIFAGRFAITAYTGIEYVPGVKDGRTFAWQLSPEYTGKLFTFAFRVRDIKVYWNEIPLTDPGAIPI